MSNSFSPREAFYLAPLNRFYPIKKAAFSSDIKRNITSLIALYSYGYDLEFLDEYLHEMLDRDYAPVSWTLENMGDYYLAISLVSWIQLRIPNYDWSKIEGWIPIKEDRLLNFIASEDEELDYSKMILNLDPYIFLHNYVVDQTRIALNVSSFLRHFYHAQKGLPWYNSHIEKPLRFFGYWSFSLAAMIHKLKLDDAPFVDHMYYPRDLLGKTLLKTWEDSARGDADRKKKEELQLDFRQKSNQLAIEEQFVQGMDKAFAKVMMDKRTSLLSPDIQRKMLKIAVFQPKDMKDMKVIKNQLTTLGKEIQLIEWNSDALDQLDLAKIEATVLTELKESTAFSQEKLEAFMAQYQDTKVYEERFQEWKQKFQHLGEMLVASGNIHDYEDEAYWEQVENMMKDFGFTSWQKQDDIKENVAIELKDKLRKKMNLANFDVSLSEFLNKKI